MQQKPAEDVLHRCRIPVAEGPDHCPGSEPKSAETVQYWTGEPAQVLIRYKSLQKMARASRRESWVQINEDLAAEPHQIEKLFSDHVDMKCIEKNSLGYGHQT